MEKQVPEILALLEKQAANTNATKPVTVDVNSKKGFAGFANKLSALSIGKPKKDEPVDHSIDDRAVYLLIKVNMKATESRDTSTPEPGGLALLVTLDSSS